MFYHNLVTFIITKWHIFGKLMSSSFIWCNSYDAYFTHEWLKWIWREETKNSFGGRYLNFKEKITFLESWGSALSYDISIRKNELRMKEEDLSLPNMCHLSIYNYRFHFFWDALYRVKRAQLPPLYRVSQEKCPTFLKWYCLKYEYLIMGFMICLDRVILPVHLGTIFIWISACMTEHQTIFSRLPDLTCAQLLVRNRIVFWTKTARQTKTPKHTHAHTHTHKHTRKRTHTHTQHTR